MGLTFLIVDKKRKYTPVIGDMLDVTGHKLLVALNEERAKELIRMVPVDIILLEYEDLPLWLNTLEDSNYASPIFFLDNYEYAENLLRYGFTDVNFVTLPFNPFDLLTKAIVLSKDVISVGLINTVLYALRRKLSVNLVLNGINQCVISIKSGFVRGYTCSDDVLRKNILKGDINIEFLPYEEKTVINRPYRNNLEFFSSLILAQEWVVKKRVEHVVEEITVPVSKLDYSQPIEIFENVFWIGSLNRKDILHVNTVLRIYKKENVTVPILINPGYKKDYADIRSKIEQIIGPIDNLKAVVVMGTKPEDYMNAYTLMQANYRLTLITSIPIAWEMNTLGIPMSRIRLIESFPDGRLKLATGDTLRFIHMPFSAEKGSFGMYEEDTRILYTGDMFSSYTSVEDYSLDSNPKVEDLILFQKLNLPSNRVVEEVLRKLETLEIRAIIPRYGNIIWNVEQVRDLLRNLKVGLDAAGELEAHHTLETTKEIVQECRKLLTEEDFVTFTKRIGNYAYITDELEDLYVDVKYFPAIVFSTLVSMDISADIVLRLLKILHGKNLLNFTI